MSEFGACVASRVEGCGFGDSQYRGLTFEVYRGVL